MDLIYKCRACGSKKVRHIGEMVKCYFCHRVTYPIVVEVQDDEGQESN